MDINADGKKYFDIATFESYEEALKVCDWNWHLKEDESELEQAKASYEEMQDQKIALTRKYIEKTETGRPDTASLKKIKDLHNKYAPENYQLV